MRTLHPSFQVLLVLPGFNLTLLSITWVEYRVSMKRHFTGQVSIHELQTTQRSRSIWQVFASLLMTIALTGIFSGRSRRIYTCSHLSLHVHRKAASFLPAGLDGGSWPACSGALLSPSLSSRKMPCCISASYNWYRDLTTKQSPGHRQVHIPAASWHAEECSPALVSWSVTWRGILFPCPWPGPGGTPVQVNNLL